MHSDRDPDVFFSVVIPSYNSEKTIERAILSCVHQVFHQLEIIVVDDASVDRSIDVVNFLIDQYPEEKIHLVVQPVNSGPSSCRNLGWKLAAGEFVAFLDSDDVWAKDKLSVCHYWIKSLNCDLLAHSHIENVEALSVKIDRKVYQARNRNYFSLLVKNIGQTSCVVVRKNLSKVLSFDESMRYTEDHELWLRVSFSFSCFFVSGPALTALGRPALSKGGLSENRWAMRKGEISMYFKSVRYSKFSIMMLPFLFFYSMIKFLIKEFSIVFFGKHN